MFNDKIPTTAFSFELWT